MSEWAFLGVGLSCFFVFIIFFFRFRGGGDFWEGKKRTGGREGGRKEGRECGGEKRGRGGIDRSGRGHPEGKVKSPDNLQVMYGMRGFFRTKTKIEWEFIDK